MKIGILGSGQLAKMLALSGYRLGLQFSCFSPEHKPIAADVMPHHLGSWDDETELWLFARDLDLITFETENIPLGTVRFLKGRGKSVFPDPDALSTAQDRLLEKNFFRKLGIPTAEFFEINSQADLEIALVKDNSRHILKTRRNGYDGKNQYRIDSVDKSAIAWAHVAQEESILENLVEFDGECSLIAVRDRSGNIRFYPLIQNLHRGGILIMSHLLDETLARIFQPKAEAFARSILEDLDYSGILTIEFFFLGESLIANEMAPRVHNSGHWTIEASFSSQFENHLRAITALPLGDTRPSQDFVMFNILDRMPPLKKLAGIEALQIHDYRKQAAVGRKMGHLTLLKPSQNAIRQINELVFPAIDLVTHFVSRARDRH